jgi:hypothetical protein
VNRGELAPMLERPTPPPELEARVARSLRERGLIGRRRPSLRPWLAAAAAILIFIAGYATSNVRRADAGVEPAAELRFALLLYESPTPGVAIDDVGEHQDWARQLAADGHEVSGEKLGVTTAALPETPAPGSDALQGFFVISARDAGEAVAIARSSPHFRNGGRVVVRAIDPT